jgi:hypothetical protein
VELLAGRPASAAVELLTALRVFVAHGDAHVCTTLRWSAAVAAAAGRSDAAAQLAAAGAVPSGHLSDLLARATLDRLIGARRGAWAPGYGGTGVCAAGHGRAGARAARNDRARPRRTHRDRRGCGPGR